MGIYGGHYSAYHRASPVCQEQSLQPTLTSTVLTSEDLKVLGSRYLEVTGGVHDT